ncbi:TPA: PD-(D/E)XK nuclease family protein, partial [Streptococcus equi subsp. equi]|nr:PD-(D/E)XK nuclease family protein [Streptococcus equi subsp. equi]
DEDQLARISLQGSSQKQPQAFYDKLSNSLRGQGEHPELIGQELMTKLADFDGTLRDWRQFAKLHSLYELIWKIFNDRFYFDFVASQPKAEQAQANLYALAIRADQFEQSGYKGLSRFIGMIDKVLETQNDLADVEVERPKHAVNLMTIHKSKGLEFHYVFILNCDKRFAMADLQAPIILNRDEGIGIKYVANVKELLREEKLASLKVTMETLPYQLNKQQLRLATLSEQMRLLYVAMTRAEKKVYLIGKASKEKVQEKTADNSSEGRLALASRERLLSFQDWLLAIAATFSKEDLFIDVRFVDDSDLTPEAVGQLRPSGLLQADDLKDNRQTEDIARALDMLDKVSELNASYQAAIELPTVRTPSQLKTLYEPLMDTDGVDIIDQPYHRPKTFELPDFSKKKAVEPSQVGSSLHELMQRIPMSDQVTAGDIEQTLQLVSADAEVKARLDIEKVTSFFATTELGQLLQEHHQRLHREAPFAMLKKDSLSQEQYVVRGIIDGYLLFEDRIVLFDYKTDRYQQSAELKQRYQQQMDLYAEALSQSYGIARIEKYLVLMGGSQLEVVRLA